MRSGQALVETVLSLVVFVSIVYLAVSIHYFYWSQARCIYLTFETVLHRLSGAYTQADDQNSMVKIEESPTAMLGSGTCGRAKVRVQVSKFALRRY